MKKGKDAFNAQLMSTFLIDGQKGNHELNLITFIIDYFFPP